MKPLPKKKQRKLEFLKDVLRVLCCLLLSVSAVSTLPGRWKWYRELRRANKRKNKKSFQMSLVVGARPSRLLRRARKSNNVNRNQERFQTSERVARMNLSAVVALDVQLASKAVYQKYEDQLRSIHYYACRCLQRAKKLQADS